MITVCNGKDNLLILLCTGQDIPQKTLEQLLQAVAPAGAAEGLTLGEFEDVFMAVPAVCMFMKYDTDGSGALNKQEVREILDQLQTVYGAGQQGQGGQKARHRMMVSTRASRLLHIRSVRIGNQG